VAVPILLDTHILFWWAAKLERLSRAHADTLREAESRGDPLAISAMTLWELAMMASRGRVQSTAPLESWIEEMTSYRHLTILPLTARIAAESVQLGPDFPKDPADRIIVATALCHGLRLVTADDRIRKWGKVLLV